jgi:hypothetical protein
MKTFLNARAARGMALGAATLGLTACGGGDYVANVGGTVGGLNSGQSLTLQNDGKDNLSVSKNGSFFFSKKSVLGEAYKATLLTQPNGQVCQVFNGTGSVNSRSDDVTSIVVTCVNLPVLAGTVSGLAAGTTLTLANAGVQLPVNSNGGFAFPGVLAIGTSYQVSVLIQPTGQTCTVTNGSGTTTNTITPPTPVTVTCRQ